MIIFTPKRANNQPNPNFFQITSEIGKNAGLKFLPDITHRNRAWTSKEATQALADPNSVIEFKDWNYIGLFKNSARKKIILLDQFYVHDYYKYLLNGKTYQLDPNEYYPRPRNNKPDPTIDNYPAVIDYSWADLIICIQEENLVGPEWIEFFNNPGAYFGTDSNRVISIVSGMNDDLANGNIFPHNILRVPVHFWFSWVSAVNDPIEYYANYKRPYKFEALLGGAKENRQFIFDKLKEHQLLDAGLVSISAQTFTSPTDKQYFDVFYRSPELDNYDDAHVLSLRSATRKGNWIGHTTSIAGTPDFRVAPGKYSQHVKPYGSFVMPAKIYQQTWFSIIAESIVHNSDFFTEKTAKVLLGGRIFITFGPHHSLKNLRQCGFKTFNKWIDESYDEELNDEKRWSMAFDQVIRLVNHPDPANLYKKVEDVIQHNYQLISNPKLMLAPVDNFIQSFLNGTVKPVENWVPMKQRWTREWHDVPETLKPPKPVVILPEPLKIPRRFDDYDIRQALAQARLETQKRRARNAS